MKTATTKISLFDATCRKLGLHDYNDGATFSHFTIGRGDAPYHFVKSSQTGMYYCFRRHDDGSAGSRRAVKPSQEITIHYHTADEEYELWRRTYGPAIDKA